MQYMMRWLRVEAEHFVEIETDGETSQVLHEGTVEQLLTTYHLFLSCKLSILFVSCKYKNLYRKLDK